MAFGRWDVERFLSEVGADEYMDWLAYDAIEPLNVGDQILLRLFGRKEEPAPPPPAEVPEGSTPGWEMFKHNMKMHMLITGKRRRGRGR